MARVELRRLLGAIRATVYTSGNGTGQYTNEAGETFEEPCLFYCVEVTDVAYPVLVSGLADLCEYLGQESIALSTLPSSQVQFITPRR
jgi:hypothetical protein